MLCSKHLQCTSRCSGKLRWPVSGTTVATTAAVPQYSSRNARQVVAKAATINIDSVYTSNAEDIKPYIGHVRAVRLKASRALETTKTLQAGETLVISTPIAVITRSAAETAAAAAAAGDQDVADDDQYEPTDDDIDQITDQLINSSSARIKGWLPFLDDGALDAVKTAQLPDLQALAQNLSSSSSSSTVDQGAAAAAAGLDEDTILDVADINTRVLVEDDVIFMLQQAENNSLTTTDVATPENNRPNTLVGIWPEITLMPHSCCPNASVVAVNPAAVVTAARSIPKEGLVYQNMLGAGVLAPLSERRRVLEKMTGIKCVCPRCRDEEKQDKNLLALIEDIHEACSQQILPELEAAVETDDDQALESLCDQLGAYCEVVDAGFSKMAVKQQTQIWLQASLFKLYELTAVASAAATGEPDARSMELLAALAAEVAPGSSEHIFWAQQYRAIIAGDEESYFDGALRQAETMVMNAFKMRYGNISRELYVRLQQLQQEASDEANEDEAE